MDNVHIMKTSPSFTSIFNNIQVGYYLAAINLTLGNSSFGAAIDDLIYIVIQSHACSEINILKTGIYFCYFSFGIYFWYYTFGIHVFCILLREYMTGSVT